MDNHEGAIVNAINYGEVVVGGDILNRCNVMDVMGPYSRMKQYFPSYFFGGTGEGHKGVGLLLAADGRIDNDASVISSFGSNVISGTHGVTSEARSNIYISYHHHSSNLFGSSDTTVYSNQVQPAMIVSFGGSNYFQSTEGGMSFLSTNFFAAGDQYFAALKDINFFSLILEDRVVKHSSSFFGLNTHSSFQSDEYVVPTVVENPGNTTIISLEGSIKILDSLLENSGLLTIKGRDIVISATPLNHTQIERSSGFSINLPFLNSNNLTPLIADYKNLMGSQGGIEWAANVWNLGFDGYNSANSLMSAMRTGNIGQGFSPASYLTNVSISFGSSRTEAHWQTIADNIGIRVGAMLLEAFNSVTFGNGIPVYVAGDATIHAKIFNQFGAQLHSSVESESESLSLGLSMQGVNVGESASGYSSHSTYYQNQLFHVGGHLEVIAEEWDMRDANTEAGTLDAKVKKLSVTSDTNTTSSSSWSESLNTNGSFAFSVSSNRSAIIGRVSGIVTSNGTRIIADEIDLYGARIISYGASDIEAKTINSTPVKEFNRGTSFGISGNFRDFYKDPNVAWQQAIPAETVSIGSQNYQATQDGTIWNSAGTPVVAGAINGSLNQANPSGLNVNQNDHLNLQLKVPVFNPEGLQQIQENKHWEDSKKVLQEKQTDNDRLYNDSDNDDEEKQATEQKPAHPTRSQPVSKPSSSHVESDLDLEEEKGPGTLPKNLGLDLDRIDTSRMNEYAHEDKEAPSQQPKAKKGYSNLDDEGERQRYADMAFNRRGNSSTQRINDSFKGKPSSRNESKDSFANDEDFSDKSLPNLYNNDPVFQNRYRGIFTPPASRPTSDAYSGYGQTAGANALDYVDAFNQGVERVRDSWIQQIEHPIDALQGAAENTLNLLVRMGNSDVVRDINAFGQAFSDANPIFHPWNNVISPLANFANDVVVMDVLPTDSQAYQDAQSRMSLRFNSAAALASFANDVAIMDVLPSNSAEFQDAYSRMKDRFQNEDEETVFRQLGTLAGAWAGTELGAIGVSELQLNRASAYFEKAKLEPIVGSTLARQLGMLADNAGYLVARISSFDRDTIGTKNSGTFLTDKEAITEIIGKKDPNQDYTVGLITFGNQVSYYKARLLALGLGTDQNRFLQGFRFAELTDLRNYHPASPLYGNDNHVMGAGLPLGGPELWLKEPLETRAYTWSLSRESSASNYLTFLSRVGLFGESIVPGHTRSASFEPLIIEIDPKDIGFSQSTVAPRFSNNRKVNTVINELREGVLLQKNMNLISLFVEDGKIFAVNNRRMLAFYSSQIGLITAELVSRKQPGVDLKINNRLEPIEGNGWYIVVVDRKNREEALNRLVEFKKIKKGISRVTN
jgi:hypothetical protein